MINKITVIIIDKEAEQRDFSLLNKDNETSFQIFWYTDSNDIYYRLGYYKGFDVLVTIGDLNDYSNLFNTSYEIRRRWIHFNSYEPDSIYLGIKNAFKGVLDNGNLGEKVFSIFTCTYKTSEEQGKRLYESLLKQTYNTWNWWILDDTPDGEECYLSKIHDYRVKILKNVNMHGNIGFNKHAIAMMCNGDYLLEVDHDDELDEHCLEYIDRAFKVFPDADFVYTNCLEIRDGKPYTYDEGWGLGAGINEMTEIKGEEMLCSLTPNINALTIRHIVSQPNHARCWKRDFYHRIGGHDQSLSVMDDMDLLIRTFLYGKMCKVNKVLYFQHGTDNRAQFDRISEIFRSGRYIREKYDKKIHERALQLGIGDPYWNEETQTSEIYHGVKEGTKDINYIYYV